MKLENYLHKKSFLLIFLLVGFVWISHILTKALDYNSNSKDSLITNHFLNNFEMTETNAKGEVLWILEGDRLERFPNSLRSEVTNPKMKIKSDESSSWIISAKHALDPDSLFKSIYLTDNVIFNKYSMNTNEVNITTTKAIIYPIDEIIETSEYATITTPNSKTVGDGVVADLKKGYINILSNAKRISYTDNRSEQLEGDRMQYDLNKKTWVLLKKQTQNDKMQIQERVKTILKTRKIN